MKIVARLKNLLAYRFTFMLVPHGAGVPRQINIHLSVILLFLSTWTALTFWSSYLSARHVDYWRTELSNRVLRMKIQFLVAQLDQSRSFLDEVKTVEGQLRDLLQYKNGASILKEEKPAKLAATGGPSTMDQSLITHKMLTDNNEMTWNQLYEKAGLVKSEAKARVLSFQDISGWIDRQRSLLRATPHGWPCPGRVTSHYGMRVDPFTGDQEYHPGVDISGARGTPIRATADGIVRIASWNGGYGNLVVIQHDFGYSTRYAHNNRFMVKVGERVKRGQIVALMGDTGRASGMHCHYEVWRYAQRKNPFAYLKNDYADSEVLARLAKAAPQSLPHSRRRG